MSGNVINSMGEFSTDTRQRPMENNVNSYSNIINSQ